MPIIEDLTELKDHDKETYIPEDGKKNDGKTEIYYFSGTGNSLHIAKELQQRLPEAELIPMVGALDNDIIKTKAQTVGFVFPIYLTTIPAPVRRFLERLDMGSVRYAFTAVTRIGTFCVANINVNRILKKKGKSLQAQFILNMANNSPTGLKPGKGDDNWLEQISAEKVAHLEAKVQASLDEIQKVVSAQEIYPRKTIPNPFLHLLERTMYLLTNNSAAQINFYADPTCTGCGICAKVCLSGKVIMQDSRPLWQKEVKCYYCYACFNFCPRQAILVKDKYSKKDGRYFHPDITAADIAGQKIVKTGLS